MLVYSREDFERKIVAMAVLEKGLFWDGGRNSKTGCYLWCVMIKVEKSKKTMF